VATPEIQEWLGTWWPADLPPPWDHEAWAAMEIAHAFGGLSPPAARDAVRAADVETVAREVSRWELETMGPDRLLVTIQITQRLMDWAQAQKLAAVGELHRRRGAEMYPEPS
jgi:hypothetical protein